MNYVINSFLIRQPPEIVVYGYPLPQGFVYGGAEYPVEMRLAAEYQGKAVYGVALVVHQHFYVVKDAGRKVLCLIYGQQQGLSLFLVLVCCLFLYGPEHARLAALGRNAQHHAWLTVKFCHAYGGQTNVERHMQVGIEAAKKVSQAVHFALPWTGSKKPYPPCLGQMPQAPCHPPEILGFKMGSAAYAAGIQAV